MRFGPGQRGDAAKLATMLLLVTTAVGARALQTVAPMAAMPSSQEAAVAPEVKPYVLHVYQNLMQIPTVVVMPKIHNFALSQNFIFEPVTGIDTGRFHISLDAGSTFEPKHMHVEGNEPITLAIVVDRNSHLDFLLPSLPKQVEHMVTTALLPHDHVSLYTLDCGLELWRKDVTANSPELFPAVYAESMGPRKSSKCSSRASLFDSLATVVRDMSTLPGRRVMVVISRGENDGGTIKWRMLRQYAAGHSTAIFGVVPLPEMGTQSYNVFPGPEDPFDAVCEMSGGLRLTSGNTDLGDTLMNLIDIVRQRYILEFSRPDDGIPGEHVIDVTIARSNALVRPGGITVPLADPSILNDPTTVRSAPSTATYGKRKVMKQP
jgi:hypothetical protein